jgi:hypothetical protein
MKKKLFIRSYRLVLFLWVLNLIITCRQNEEPTRNDYLDILSIYSTWGNTETETIPFTYADQSDTGLTELRTGYNLDEVAGSGSEIERILNLMQWVHETVPHAGSASNPWPPTAKNIIQADRAVNCRMIATVLNEVYLSMGFRSRILVCLPEDYPPPDCHVVNIVYSDDLEKWLLMDASFEMYFYDDNNELLGPEEIRSRYISGLPIMINPGANHNGSPVAEWAETYMIKNLIWFNTPVSHGYNTEGSAPVQYAALIPGNYTLPDPGPDWTVVTTPSLFWQNP